MKEISKYSSVKEMEEEFNDWFGYFITGFDKEKGWLDEERSINDITDNVIDIMIAITDWDEDVVKNTNRWNVVYWYCLYLLYIHPNDYFYIDDIFEFLNDMTPFD